MLRSLEVVNIVFPSSQVVKSVHLTGNKANSPWTWLVNFGMIWVEIDWDKPGGYCHRVARIILVWQFRVPGGCRFCHQWKSTDGTINMAVAIPHRQWFPTTLWHMTIRWIWLGEPTVRYMYVVIMTNWNVTQQDMGTCMMTQYTIAQWNWTL